MRLPTAPHTPPAGKLPRPVKLNNHSVRWVVSEIESWLAAGVDAVRVRPGWIRERPDLVRWIQSQGAEVWVTTGRLDGERLQSVIDMGVDGLITDIPARLVEAYG